MSATLARNEPADTVPLSIGDQASEMDDSQGFSDTLPLGWKHSENSTFFQPSRTEHPQPHLDEPPPGRRRARSLAVPTLAVVLALLVYWLTRH
jgi:hypothetical protein